MNKKGLIQQIQMVAILVVVVMVIVGLFTLGGIVLPILAGESEEVTNIIQTDLQNSGVAELQNASETPAETITDVLGVLELIVYLVLFGLFIGFLFIAYYVRTYPFLVFFWVGAMVIFVIAGMIMSNAYEQARNEPDLQAFYTAWGSNDLLMSYLSHIITAIGILGGIILFVLISRDSEQEVQHNYEI